MNKKGMTLIELLVYMAIAALLLAPVIMLMQNSSVNMARDAVTTDLRISGRDILNIMYEDIRNTGFKLIDATGAVDTCVTFIKINPIPTATPHVISDDPSSFKPGDGGGSGAFDELTIRKGWLKPNNNNYDYGGYYEVRYYVDNGTLKREITSFEYVGNNPPNPDPTAGKPDHVHIKSTPVTQNIATYVEALQFQYSVNLENWYYGNGINDPQLMSDANKEGVQYIKISVVTVDPKKLAPVKTSPQIDVGNYSYDPPDNQALREVSEIVVPIPNNGLFPQ